MPTVAASSSLPQPDLTAAPRVDLAFEILLDWLDMSFVCHDMSRIFADRTVAILQKRLGLERFLRVGSCETETRVLGLSGIDYFAVLSRMSRSHRPDRWLSAIAKELRANFTTTERIHVTDGAVRIPFSGGRERAVIIPALHHGVGLDMRLTYLIPDGNGGWQLASPDSHRQRLGEIDARRGYRLKSLIRLAKLWKARAGVEIHSYYLECFAAALFDKMPIGSYGYGLSQLLLSLREAGLEDIETPGGPAERVVAAPSRDARIVARRKLQRSAELACEAVLQERYSNIQAAFDRWNLVFGGAFPKFRPARREAASAGQGAAGRRPNGSSGKSPSLTR